MKCWEKKTPYQMGLILILCIAIPFLIAMIVIYILSATMWNGPESCDSLYARYYLLSPDERKIFFDNSQAHNDQDVTIHGGQEAPITTQTTASTTISTEETTKRAPQLVDQFSTTTTTEMSSSLPQFRGDYLDLFRKRKEREICVQHSKYPFLAVLLQKGGAFKCTIVLLTPTFALTTTKCINDTNETLKVRTNSDYWYQGGFLREIKKLLLPKTNAKIVAIKMAPLPVKNICFTPMRIRFDSLEKNETTTIFQWKTNKTGVGDRGEVKYEVGAPILDGNAAFIGFVSKEEGDELSYVPLTDYRDWFEQIIHF